MYFFQCLLDNMYQLHVTQSGFLLRAGTRVNYPAMTLHVPGYRRDGRSFFFIIDVAGLEFDGGTAAICRLADWPQCLVNETVDFGQFGRALFHLQVMSN